MNSSWLKDPISKEERVGDIEKGERRDLDQMLGLVKAVRESVRAQHHPSDRIRVHRKDKILIG